MKKLRYIVLALLLVCSCFLLTACGGGADDDQEASEFGYVFNSTGEYARIVRYRGEGAEVVIPDTLGGKPVKEIGQYTFLSSPHVTSISIPAGITKIEDPSFYTLPLLETITVAEDNVGFTVVDGVLYHKKMGTVYCYPQGKKGDSYTIPDSVKTIYAHAFYNSQLKEVTMSDKVTKVQTGAFAESKNLTTVHFSSKTSQLFESAFENCSALAKLELPESLTSIGSKCFSGCSTLTEVTVPANVSVIDSAAFADCTALKTCAVLGKQVQRVAEDTFSGDTSLEKVSFAAGLMGIAENAFKNCSALTDVVLDDIPEAKEGETVIEFWCGMWETWNQNWVKAQVDSWNAKEDRPFYVNLTWMDTSTMAQQLAAARAAEIAPDVYTADYSSVANDYANGYTLDLTNLVSQSAWDDLLDSAKGFVTIHDALVAYPWMMEPSIVMYYDKEAFTSVGLDPESPPTTWDELIEYAEMLTTEDRFGMDIAASYNFWGWFYTNNNDQYMLTDDWSAANVNNESMKEFAEFYKTIRNSNYCSQTPLKDQNVGVYAVLEGRSAIAFSGSWGVGVIDTDYPEKRDVIGVAAAPTKDGSPMHATSGGWNLVVDAKAKHPTEAGQWIEYMLGDTSDPSKVADFFVAANFSKFTTRKSVSDYLVANTAASNDERVQTIQSDIMPYVVAEPTYAWEIFQYGLNAFDDIAINGTDIDTAFNDMEALINQYIADSNLAGKNPRAN